jgi:peptidyl-prolyl cis-trans isomerase D
MLRQMRSNSKYVFWILAVSFIGWLAYGQVQEILTGSRDTVLKINRDEVHLAQYQGALEEAYERMRQQNGIGTLTQEDEKQIQDQVVGELIQNVLLHQQYDHLKITTSDDELRQVVYTNPPPEITRMADFQTNGRFDISKWQRWLSSGSNPEFLLQLEARYREQILQVKLSEYLTADIYLSDGKLWRIYRDQHDSVKVALLAVRPQDLPDSLAPVSDAELQRYYADHKKDFTEPAVAYLSFVAQPSIPDASDTAAAEARVRRVRQEVAGATLAKFGEVAKRESSDSVSGARGGDLGWIKRNETGYDPDFLKGLRSLQPGQLSAPIRSAFGYHLIRVEAAQGDSVHVRHILIPIALQGAHRDLVESRADSLERLAAEHEDGTAIDTAGARLGLPVGHADKLVQGERMALGRYVIPNISIWAFDAKVGETSALIEGERAYYVFRLDSLTPEGVRPLAVVRDRVAFGARLEKKKTLVHRRAQDIAAALAEAGTQSLETVAAAHHWRVDTLGPFTRTTPPAQIQREPVVVGTSFGLGVGQHSGLLASDGGDFFVGLLWRKLADSSAWLAQRDQQRSSMLEPVRQARVQSFIAGLRQQAKIVDRRKELFRPQNTTAGS